MPSLSAAKTMASATPAWGFVFLKSFIISDKFRISSRWDSFSARPTSKRGIRPIFFPWAENAGKGSDALKPVNQSKSLFLEGVPINSTSVIGFLALFFFMQSDHESWTKERLSKRAKKSLFEGVFGFLKQCRRGSLDLFR